MNQPIDLNTLSINDLKALAYDHLALIENSQRVIQLVNQELNKRAQLQNVVKPESLGVVS